MFNEKSVYKQPPFDKHQAQMTSSAKKRLFNVFRVVPMSIF